MINKKHLDALIEAIKDDFKIWTNNRKSPGNEYSDSMIKAFNEGISISEGSKYIKIMTERCVWGFIVKNTFGKFVEGDILLAANFKAPATNKARGNILDGGYKIRWTGPNYL